MKKVEIKRGRLSVEIGELYGRRGTVLRFTRGNEMLPANGKEVMLPRDFFPQMISEEAWEKAARVCPNGTTLVDPWELIVREERGK